MFLLSVTVVILVTLLYYFNRTYQYWQKRDIPYLKPQIPFGAVSNPLFPTEKSGSFISRIYNEMRKRKWKHGGFYVFVSPIYLPTDLNYIKNILTKDFDYFDKRGMYYNEKDDPLSAHLINLGGKKGHILRKKLNPTFTPSNMKMMFQTLSSCVDHLLSKIDSNEVIKAHKVAANFTIDVISSCALGLDCKTFKEEHSLLLHYSNKCLFWSKFRWFVQVIAALYVSVAKQLKITVIPKETSDFFLEIVSSNIKYREENNYVRKDLMQVLIDQKKSNTLSVSEIAAQCLAFFVAGFDTSAATLTFALYEIARNLDVQEKIRAEIGEINYETLLEMRYLDQVIDETLRKYPPILFVPRQCCKDYKIPESNIVIEKGTFVLISIFGIHHDQEYYPDPAKFDPERFNKENKKLRHPYAFIPFGKGPRSCIGKRFGLMQIKFCVASILKNYKLTVNPKTPEPLTIEVDRMVLLPKNDIFLDLVKVGNN